MNHLSFLVFFFFCFISSVIHAETTPTIDLLVLYTTEMKEYYGGDSGAQALILNAVESANTAYENSHIDLELNLVHAEETDYTESSTTMEDDITYLYGSDDGYMDEVHALRDAWGADVVSLFRHESVSGVAGIGFQLDDLSGSSSYAFSVVADVNAANDLTFAHELGHNMGADHALEDDTYGNGLFAYSNGYRFFGGDGSQYRTVMAYSPGTRIDYFSTPEVFYEGEAVGIAEGEPDAADNATTLNVSAPVVAAYREEKADIPEFTIYPQGLTVISGAEVLLACEFSATPTISMQWYQGESGDFSLPLSEGNEEALALSAMESNDYWIRISNDNGLLDSETLSLVIRDEPSGASGYDQSQTSMNTSFGLRDGESHWQEFVPEKSYLEAFELYLDNRSTSSGYIEIELQTEWGLPLLRHTLNAADFIDQDWYEVPAGIFLYTGDTYRIVVTASSSSSRNYFSIIGQKYGDDPYPQGSSSLEADYEGSDFTFRTSYRDVDDLGDAPTIQSQPEDVFVEVGEAAEFSVAVNGTAPFKYEWFKDGVSLGDTNVARYKISSVEEDDFGTYQVYIRNLAGEVWSAEVTLADSACSFTTIFGDCPAQDKQSFIGRIADYYFTAADRGYLYHYSTSSWYWVWEGASEGSMYLWDYNQVTWIWTNANFAPYYWNYSDGRWESW